MRVKSNLMLLGLTGALALMAASLPARMVFEDYSPYHHIRVVDRGSVRVLRFNDSEETRMSLADPLKGHFEYTEFFHMPWLWNTNIQRVVMLGLGGGSIQRAYLHYYPQVTIDTAEMDPMVIAVAGRYFGVKASDRHKIFQSDGRVFLRRGSAEYDVIIADAYTTSRYGSSLPPHLTTREFFTLASSRLSTNGVLAYNVIGQKSGWRGGLMGSVYRTMREVFPQVYLFPAQETMNVVLVATKSEVPLNYTHAQRLGAERLRLGAIKFPNFEMRLRQFESTPPRSFSNRAVLTDDHAPIESLLR